MRACMSQVFRRDKDGYVTEHRLEPVEIADFAPADFVVSASVRIGGTTSVAASLFDTQANRNYYGTGFRWSHGGVEISVFSCPGITFSPRITRPKTLAF